MADPDDPETTDTGAPTPSAQHEAPRPAPGPGPYPYLLHQQLLTPRAPLTPGASVRAYPMVRAAPTVPARWAEDPTGRHQWRWWNGVVWTEHVADDGQSAVDPLT
jgi:hypothetical protein